MTVFFLQTVVCHKLLRIKQEETIMSAVYFLVLLMLGAFIHSSYALKCYKCDSVLGGDCDDPYDNGSEHECGDAKYKSCFKAKGKATCKNT